MLDARGTSVAPITFTSIDTALACAFWRGIDFQSGVRRLGPRLGGHLPRWKRSDNTGNVNFRSGSSVMIGARHAFTHSEDYAAVIYSGSAPMFTGPPSDRAYTFNGQRSNPGAGDPAFDCVRDIAASTCMQL